ncbi:MAG: LysR family transcriptional regulator [Bdellovibrionota bacterium]
MTIVESGGFQKASKITRISQPAISQSLANLERKLGEKLILRTTPIQPTPLGYEFMKSARQILEKEQEFLLDLKRIKNGYLQKLSLAVDYLINEYHCHNYVVSALKQLPEIQFKIKKLPAREIIPTILNGDLGLGAFQKNMSKLTACKLFEEKTYLVTSKKNSSYKTYKNDPFEFLKKTILLSSYIDEPEIRPSKKKIRDYFKDIWEVNNISLQIKLLKQGIGATYIPETILQNDPLAKQFIILDKLPFSLITKPYGIYHKSNAELSEVAKIFLVESQKSF